MNWNFRFIDAYFVKFIHHVFRNFIDHLNIDWRCFSLSQNLLYILKLYDIIMALMKPRKYTTLVKLIIVESLSESSCRLSIANNQPFNHFFSVKTSKDIWLSPSFVYLAIFVNPISRQRAIGSHRAHNTFFTNIKNMVPSSHHKYLIPLEFFHPLLFPQEFNSLSVSFRPLFSLYEWFTILCI